MQKTKFILLLFIFLVGCATSYDSKGVYHRVQRGETLSSIARGYGTSLQELAEYNNIEDPKSIASGQKLYIPAKKSKAPRYKKLPWDIVDAAAPKKHKRVKEKGDKEIKFERGRFIWPVDGALNSKFGMRNGVMHEGIDIKGKIGTPIKAAADGEVVFSDRMGGYGNIVILKHKDDFFTAYAHNKINLVKKGKDVKQGDKIAEVGKTGRTTGVHLHFEIRYRQKPRNPLFFLPEK